MTFIEGYLVDWVIPEKNPNRGSRRGLEDILKNPGIFRFVSLPFEIVNSREKKELIPGNSAKLWCTLSLVWKFH